MAEVVHLPPFPRDSDVQYLTTETETNAALATIVDGVIGFDTEFMARTPGDDEDVLNTKFSSNSSARKAALLGWQLIELNRDVSFEIQWDLIGLCVVQIARGDTAWVVNILLMQAFPKELRRILTSPAIIKTGVGITNDIAVMWNDARLELKNLVDAGMMARLLLCRKYSESSYSNLSMQIACAEVLGVYVNKDQRLSDWNGELDHEQIHYAAVDAMASLRLYDKLLTELGLFEHQLGQTISVGWYTFNSTHGEATRTKKTIRGEEVPWATKDCPWFFGNKFQQYYA
ncbi:ribonuclease H-like domain-containing protein [Mycena rebaudengoi]|nr:ribonuclease H-like domain-containing protein [Mycena rebaudengoi]